MPAKSDQLKAEKQVIKEMRSLAKEVKKLKDMDFLRVFSNPYKFMFFSFMKGIMVGFGSVLGASVVVGIFVFALAQISFVPYLGDFVEEIISQVQITQINNQ